MVSRYHSVSVTGSIDDGGMSSILNPLGEGRGKHDPYPSMELINFWMKLPTLYEK